jgi:hypothetical protein
VKFRGYLRGPIELASMMKQMVARRTSQVRLRPHPACGLLI